MLKRICPELTGFTDSFSMMISYFSNVMGHILNNSDDLLRLLILAFGWYIAYNVRRPYIFRFKLFVLFTLPMVIISLAWSAGLTDAIRSPLSTIFSLLMMILYWRELKCLTTSKGYHIRTLSTLMKYVPDMVWMKDVDGKFTYVNKAAADKLLKMPIDQTLGMTCEEIEEYHRSKGERYTFDSSCGSLDNEIMESRKPQLTIECGDIDGEFIALQIYNVPIIGYNDKIVGLLGIARDITLDYKDHMGIMKAVNNNDMESLKTIFKPHYSRNMCGKDTCKIIYTENIEYKKSVENGDIKSPPGFKMEDKDV